ncbi:Flp pilus assembly complex ATPase component TadA [bacterium]|nr:Flp pilus assembly complex ATPase component TadA [bacterium]
MNELLSKLKNSINKKIYSQVKPELMNELLFVPINVRDNYLFVAINSKTNKEKVSEILANIYNYTIKYIQLADNDLNELLISPATETTESDSSKTETVVTKQNKHKIGEMLLDDGIITENQLLEAMAESKKTKMPIGSCLVKLNYISLEQLKRYLKLQTGYDFVSSEQIGKQAPFVNLLSEDFIKVNRCIPVFSDGRTLTIGTVTILKPAIVKNIQYLTGLQVKQLLITAFEFENALEKYFSEEKKLTEKLMQAATEEAGSFRQEQSLQEMVDKDLNDSAGSVAAFVNKIVTSAIDMGVSDIHIEPRMESYIVRYRKDGMLQKVFDIPNKVENSILSRFKVISRLNIAEHRRPQDGTFSMSYKGGSYDFRISTLPVSGKEKVVIRVLAPAVSLDAQDKKINLVGAQPNEIEKIQKMCSAPNGIILTSGPTGSGKTTTLYSVLKSLNDVSVNITTIEDPIEIRLDGINQSQINVKAGITFASCMKSILRQDPDIILIGEIRDYETLEIAVSAALTGHLVLSTVHTNSAAATVTRLIEMGAKDYLVASTLTGVIAQRLVRKLCDKCKEQYLPTLEEAQKVLKDPQEIEEFMKTPIYRNVGCENCDFTGFVGRLGVYEIMPITKNIKTLIAQGAHDLQIEEQAVKEGMSTLQQACLRHIKNGQTTIGEFVRVLGLVTD